MQISSKLLLRAAIILLGLMLVLGLYLGLSLTRATAAGATCSGTDWQKVQCYANSYIQRQVSANGEGEGSVALSTTSPDGFYVNQPTLKSMVDSNGDGTYLGEGDDLAKAPVLIDNLNQLTTVIPGTNFRCNWTENSCFEPGAVADVKNLVDNHEAATGQVPNVIDYCMTDHTAAPTTGAWGYIAQTGGLASSGSIPYVYGFTWGRDGWTNTPVTNYTATNPVSAPATVSTYTPPGTVPGSCTSASGDADLVRCAAEWAISQDTGEGNVGNGTTAFSSTAAGQVVDIRSDTPASTVDMGGTLPAVQVPIQTVFNTGLANVNPTVTNGVLIASASQGPGGIVAEGLRMLGYTTATGGYIHSGVPFYNNTLSVSQEQPNSPNSYLLDTVTAQCSGPSNGCNQIYGSTDLGAEMNTTAPTISSISESEALGGTSAHITWSTSQPGTSMVQYGTAPGGPYTIVRTGCDSGGTAEACTILRGSHSLTITGLTPGQKYYFTVTSYNNELVGSTSSENSFTTPPPMLPTDYVYYFPWYDSRVAGGWGGNDWICIANPGASSVNADIYVGNTYEKTQTLAAGAYYNWTTPELMGGPVQVRCEGCQASSNHLTVTDRTLYMGTFHETMAPEHTEASGGTTQLGTAYSWPWYDNANAGFVGDWVMVGNADPTNSATVDVYLGSTLEQSFTIAPRSVANPVQILPRTDNGPVKVVSTNGQLIFATQRVLYNNSFNEMYGNRIAP